jgi:AcrR family transcriptional regulator
MPTARHNTDGRIARGERTREAIVEAHAELLREGVLKPTGKVIAEKAGISLRTLWLNFKDSETLLLATTAYWDTADQELQILVDPGMPLVNRIDAFCEQRSVRLERIAPAARSALLGEPFSPALQKSRRIHVDRTWHEIEAAFSAELDTSGERRNELLTGLFVAASGTTWALLRDDLGRDVEGATDVMRTTFAILLQG